MRDQLALAQECLAVEDAGGSVIEFLKGLGFISAPATWQRLQLNELGRLPSRLNDGKEKTIMGKLTVENKKHAVQLALDGKNPLEYIRSCGVKNAAEAWGKIKRTVQETDPETFGKIPKRLPNPKKEPEGTLADAMQGMKDAADDFFGASEDMGLKVVPDQQEEDKRKRIMAPLAHSGLRSIGWASDFGEYVYDKRHDCITYTDCEGDEICYTVDRWIQFFHEFKTAAQLLGVEL